MIRAHRHLTLWVAALVLAGCNWVFPLETVRAEAGPDGPVGDGQRGDGRARDGRARDGARLDGGPDGWRPSGLCSSSGPGQWCWVNPVPQGNRFADVWGSGASDVFAVGSAGTIFRYDGTSWSRMSSGVSAWLNGVWGSGPANVYAVGDQGTLLHYNGKTWTSIGAHLGTSDPLYAVDGTAATDVYVAGAKGQVWRHDGAKWNAIPVTVSGASSIDLYAVAAHLGGAYVAGEMGQVYFYDKANQIWTGLGPAGAQDLYAVWASSASTPDLVVAGANGSVWYRTTIAPSWTTVLGTPSWTHYYALWGASTTDLYLVGDSALYTFNGTKLTEVKSTLETDYLFGLWGPSKSDLFLVGNGGVVMRYKGNTLTRDLPTSTLTSDDLHAVWGRPGGKEIFVAAWDDVLRFDGTAWHTPEKTTAAGQLLGLFGPPNSQRVFAVGRNGTVVVRGATGGWTTAKTPSAAHHLAGAWGTSENEVYVVGDTSTSTQGVVLKCGPTSCTALTWLPAGTGWLNSVWGSSSSDIFAVGDQSQVLHFDGITWTRTLLDSASHEPVYGVWGRSPTEVYVTGAWGTVFLYDGAWTDTSPISDSLYAAWGDAKSQRTAIAGREGQILYTAGAGWSAQDTGCGNDLYGVWVDGNQVIAVGAAGTILHATMP